MTADSAHGSAGVNRSYAVVLAPSVIDAMSEVHSKEDARRIRARLCAIEVMPHLGMRYDPVYDAARPSHEALVTYVGHYGIYYVADDACRLVQVECLEDCHRDPERRFER